MKGADVNPLEKTRFVVRCGACAKPFDSVTSPLCRCIGRRASPACPFCGSCICKLPAARSREFWLRAPHEVVLRSDEETRARSIAAVSLPGEGATKLVLVVDDDEEIRIIAAYALQQMGYATMTADGVEDAERVLSVCTPDLVLTDALMPKTDGRELCRQLKRRDPRMKVVVMTSLYTGERYRTEAHRKFGADGYLAKPIDFDELQGVLARVLEAA
jgi:CheY-like chemotaxis protein